MPKIKTHKATAKRIKIKKNSNKIIRRKAGQDHYNSKESGTVTRMKRRDLEVASADAKNIKKFIPYN